MNRHQERIQKIYDFLEHNDIDLAFRKMLDCATDTQNMQVYKQAVELTDFKEHHPNEKEALVRQIKAFLEVIKTYDVVEADTSLPVLQAIDLQKNYGLGSFTLGPVSLEIKKGQVYGLVGENGNGKTTLLRMLAKELSISVGQLFYHFSTPYKDVYELRTKLVYIPQRTEKWYGTLQDQLKFVLASYGAKPEEINWRVLLMIARLGLWKYKHLHWSELSSGYKMRFELARTLLRQPEILLLDEPLANLDVLAQQIILEDLKAIANSVNHPIALILSSQQLFEVEKISDKVIFLKNGKYKDNQGVEATQESKLIIEVDTSASREEVLQALESLGLEKLQFNAGLYVMYFDASTTFSQVLLALGAAALPVTYLRNISMSTRRFFVQ